ncbi:protein XRP2 [Nematostella vectensis]|uniref:protein XRP2 n=1 Tax=Nematostella vectensis TaxID=45351 RepID=UPI00138FB14C|nr:protein XRP2 [Nematostella vectensis]
MGCLESKSKQESPPPEPKVFSWERKDRPDPKDYTLANLKDVTVGRLPGKVNGEGFVIQDCHDCNIYIFDNSATITIDDCVGCTFFLGPIKGSVFFRDCNNCKVAVACQQFRTRDCKKMDFFLLCDSQPIIESSSGMKFGCFQYYYPELEGQFEKASLSVYNNNWSNIYDFTPAAGETTWSLLPENSKVEDFIPLPTTEEFSSMEISTDVQRSTVPLTLGTRRKPSNQSCLVVFFECAEKKPQIKEFIQKIQQQGCMLCQTKQISIKGEEISRILGSSEYNSLAEQGALVGLEVNGDNCIQICSGQIGSAGSGVYVSPDNQKASTDIDQFYNFIDMSMS